MKIFSAAQLKEWDAFTMQEQQVTQADLVMRAAKACYDWLQKQELLSSSFHIFCGKGNNGADGLALALLLLPNKTRVDVSILETGKTGSEAFQFYLQELHLVSSNIHFIQSKDFFPVIGPDVILVDAIFGTGLNQPLKETAKDLVEYLNGIPNIRISVDIPSGLFTDKTSLQHTIINANFTLIFQQYKLAFLMAENEKYVGELVMLDIELSKNFLPETDVDLLDKSLISSIVLPRKKFSHKGDYGHAALAAGSYGMMGAAVLAAKACLACGVGKLTCFVPGKGINIMQTMVPEAMCINAGDNFIQEIKSTTLFSVLGAGPGIGIHECHENWLKECLSKFPALVLDADALNTIS
ncbi:MAG: NAD(P)H-hydrate epimerase, partial [Ferruginibacter sp.]